jgi:hypothetical protein
MNYTFVCSENLVFEGTSSLTDGIERKTGKENCSIRQVGGHLIYRKTLGRLPTCDCVRTLAPTEPLGTKYKVLKMRKKTEKEIKVKIEN